MKEKDPGVLALYIGTTRLMALRADFSNQGIRVESWQEKDPAGFDQGLVRDSELATDEIRELLEHAGGTEWYDLPLYGVISNPAIRTYQVSSSLYFPGTKAIGEQDIARVISQTKAVATIPLDEVILCTVPQEYLVNDLPEVKNPLGLEGRRLSVTLHLFTMPITAYQGLSHLFDRLEVETELLIPKGLASSILALKEEEKREGVLFVDVGGHLSHFFYFYQGTLRFSKIIPWGAEAVTERISRQWEIPPRDARKLKEEFGTLESGALVPEDTIPYMDVSGRVRFKIPAAVFQEEIQNGIAQGLAIFEKEIRGIKDRFPHLYQLVFGGGATKMNGFLELLQNKLSIPSRLDQLGGAGNPGSNGLALANRLDQLAGAGSPGSSGLALANRLDQPGGAGSPGSSGLALAVRLGFASGIEAPPELVSHPGHYAILGLLKSLQSPELEMKARHAGTGFISKTLDHFKGWVHDYF